MQVEVYISIRFACVWERLGIRVRKSCHTLPFSFRPLRLEVCSKLEPISPFLRRLVIGNSIHWAFFSAQPRSCNCGCSSGLPIFKNTLLHVLPFLNIHTQMVKRVFYYLKLLFSFIIISSNLRKNTIFIFWTCIDS